MISLTCEILKKKGGGVQTNLPKKRNRVTDVETKLRVTGGNGQGER